MKLRQVRDSLVALLQKNFPGYTIRPSDAARDVRRPEFRVQFSGYSCERTSGDGRAKSADAEIWYYAENSDAARDELETVAETLDAALFGGFPAGETWLCPEEELSFSFDFESRLLCCQFSVSWLEELREEDAPFMEELHMEGAW